MNTSHKCPISGHDINRVAAFGGVSVNTVRQYFRSAPMRSTTKVRVEAGLRACGLAVTDGSPVAAPEASSPLKVA